MLAKLQSFTLVGIDAEAVEVEVDIALGSKKRLIYISFKD
jgi:hypothetical protein